MDIFSFIWEALVPAKKNFSSGAVISSNPATF